MYPLKMFRPADSGFAVANDEAEHKANSDAGYVPAFVVQAVVEEPAAVEAPKRRGRPPKAE